LPCFLGVVLGVLGPELVCGFSFWSLSDDAIVEVLT
jgi:hypothetical protein